MIGTSYSSRRKWISDFWHTTKCQVNAGPVYARLSQTSTWAIYWRFMVQSRAVVGCEALAIHLLVVIQLLACAEIDPCRENMVKELPASHSKCSDILPTFVSHFWWRHPFYTSESHANGSKLSYFSIINLTIVRCRGTLRCSDAIKFGMKSLSAIAQNWFTESGASWCRRLNAKSSNTYVVNCIYGRVTCGAKRKHHFFKWKYH